MAGTERTRTIAAVALISQTATHILAVRHNLTVGQVSLVLPQHDTMKTVLADSCPTPLPPSSCPPSRYRTIDGTCNNPDQPRWGAVNTPYLRLLPAWYADASLVSQAAHAGHIHTHAHVSLLASVWGQYLAHDLSRPLVAEGVRGEKVKCCGLTEKHPECFPIVDGELCWEYARTAPATTTDCALGVREQLNGATSFLDGSGLYGSTKRESDSLRLFENGHLKTQADWLLPRATSHTCKDAMMCFMGGDLRLNTHAGLAALQTLLVHEHNRVASVLSELNPQWGDDTVYDITIEPGVFNSVATAVLHLVLTLLPDQLPLGRHNIPLGMTALNMTILYKAGAYEQLISGLVSANSLTFDPAVSASIRGYLGGLDLVARTVQSGRDHGLPPYVVWRPLCGRRPAHSFEDLTDTMEVEHIARLQIIFANVADIDLFTGIISERPQDGALVGPTASCLLALQFKVLRQTDRYWYENDVPPAAFSKEQLFEIRKTSMARLVCNNVPGLSSVPRSAFLAGDQFLNAPVSCRDLDDMDLGVWKTRGKVVVAEDILHSVVEKGKQVVEKRRQMEKLIFEKGLVAGSKSPVGSAYANNKPTPTSLIQANTSVLLEATSQELITIMHDRRVRRQIQGLGNEFDSLDLNLPSVDISGLVPPAPLIRNCRETEEHRACDANNRFRTISGHCNNLRRPDFGRSNTVFARMLPAGYDDGISEPRTRSVSGNALPSPRTISTTIHNDISHLHARYTLMVMQFGQFLDHDITFTPVNKGFQSSILDCRDCEAQQRVHPECWPIPVPDNDPFYPAVNISSGRPFCIAFTRSLPGQQTLGAREQINQNTAFLDASQIYGQELCEARELRDSHSGYLNATRHPIRGKPLLPQETGNPECKADSGRCFKAEARRIVTGEWQHVVYNEFLPRVLGWNAMRLTGEWQHVVYNEFLPRVLGWNAMRLYSLTLKPEGYYGEYDGNCNPGILNEFATAAFRFGHSLIRRSLLRMDTSFSENHDGVELRRSFFNPDML
ncbi:Peroxidasin-like 3 [Homarus americanus]|uniref:Peroxidasin-like 3 n=1 Tax=Homarus americanus TaxID=6706 RepID=A0A8J5JGE5_HOMAM|nr:Peroxidasin-like 3 [Homarus americanus]